MNNEKIFFSKVQAPSESETVNKDSVTLNRRWVFWENYQAKQGQLAWKDTLKQIFEFNDLISFWQFWNSYPGANIADVFYNGERLR